MNNYHFVQLKDSNLYEKILVKDLLLITVDAAFGIPVALDFISRFNPKSVREALSVNHTDVALARNGR
jgi:hypothetical protein